MNNPVKDQLKTGELSLGTWVTIAHPDVSEMLCGVGWDWLLFDMEHGPLSIESVAGMIQSMRRERTQPFVRVPSPGTPQIKQVLDAGATGIIAPMVNTADDAALAVASCLYPPRGRRGMGPRRCADYGATFEQYVAEANDHLFIGVQIETARGVDNIDDILAVDGIDAALLGLGDLSSDMGYFKDRDNPRFQAAIQKVLDACKRHHVAAGMAYTGSAEKARAFADQGFTLIGIGQDDGALIEGSRQLLNGLR